MNEHSLDSTSIEDQLARWEIVASGGSFEAAMQALEDIVKLLDEGNLSLDASVRAFEAGTRLSERCQLLLETAQLRISTLSPAPEYDDSSEGSYEEPEFDQ